MNTPLHVLIIEDNEDDAELLALELESGGYSPVCERVETPEALTAALVRSSWDVIICDHKMPRFDAPAALTLLKEKRLDLPFIIVSGSIGEEVAVAAMKAGASDYIMKSNLKRLVPAVQRELREALVRSERRLAQTQLQYQAFYDALTGLPNRAFFLSSLCQWLEQVQANPPSLIAVLLLDIERYQVVKYSLGHSIADQLLVAAARRLEKCLRPTNLLARVGADEFAILMAIHGDPQDAVEIAHRIHTALKSPFNLNGSTIFSTSNIGIVYSTIAYNQSEDLLRAADTAMHYAKVHPSEGTVVFNADMLKNAVERLQLETDLQQAMKSEQFYLKYQPIITLSSGKIIGFEALVRWQHPTLGEVSPEQFISVAEATGLIIPLGKWILAEACQKLKTWQEQFPSYEPLSISVNLSGIQLTQPDLIEQIDQILSTVGLSGHYLKLEITETILMQNADKATFVLEQLQARQIQLSIDDFGTGYSSLSYLHCLPINTLKIDRSFVSPSSANSKNKDIVETILTLARNLGLEVIAEGVETAEQLSHLQKMGCQYGQGYFISKPLDFAAVVALLRPRYSINQ